MSEIPGDEAALEAFESLWRQYGNEGLWRWTKELRAFAVEWGWMPLLGGEDKKLVAARSLALMQAISSTRYIKSRYAQMRTAGYSYLIYRSDLPDVPNGCGEFHHVFDGLVLHPDDPFLQRYLPPTRWNCRCRLSGARHHLMIPRVGGRPEVTAPAWAFEDDPETGLPKHVERLFASPLGPSLSEIILAVAAGEGD